MQQLIKRTAFTFLSSFLFCLSYGQKSDGFLQFTISRKADISKIVSEIGDNRIVAIGEDTHGTKEYYDIRAAITKKLITEKGFNVFILENPYEDMLAFQDNLYTEPLDSLMKKHLFSIYQTKEMEGFLRWLKGYNKKNRVKMVGCDDSYREILPAKIKQELNKYKDVELDSLADEFEKRQLLSVDEFYDLPQHKSAKALPGEIQYGYDTYLTLLTVDSLITKKKIENERLNEMIYQAKSNYEIYWGFMNKLFLSRDSAMGTRINYFTKNKNNKIIIWANNGHIVKSSLDGEIGKMGETVHKMNPGQYYAIGFATGGGSYSYLNSPFINDDHDFSDTLFHAQLLPVKEGSWNEYLDRQKGSSYLLRFKNLSQDQKDFFSIKKPFRVVGYKKENPAKTSFNTALYPLFDILIYLKKTTNTTPVF